MSPDFQLEAHPLVLMKPRIVPPYAWVGHIPFAYLVVDLLRPACLVELGTHSGNSYLAFCQAVHALELSCRCTAVDTWQGDAHALHYGEQVYQSLRGRHDPLYESFSQLLRCRFDDAASMFADGSIDLLHIDGLHTYEAVRHDFETWLPKLSDRAVVLLHDTAVRERGFGVDRFLQELAVRYPCFDFRHSHGLGVVAVGTAVPAAFAAFMRHADDSPAAIRGFFEALASTLVDADDQPMQAAVVEPLPVVCHLYYRGHTEAFDDSRMISQPVDAADGIVDLQFRLPAGIRADYLRIDPADLPGVYGFGRVMLRSEGASAAQNLEHLPARLGHVNGELLPAVGSPCIRLGSFDGDPNLEFEIGSVLEGSGEAGLEVNIRLHYELVVRDPVLHRLLEQQAEALIGMRQLSRGRINVQNLSREYVQQQMAMHRLEGELHGLAGRMHGLEDGVRSLEGGMHGLEDRVRNLEGGIHNLEDGVRSLESGIQNLEGRMQNSETEVARSHAAIQASLQQLQQAIDQLTRRSLWSVVRRLIKRG